MEEGKEEGGGGGADRHWQRRGRRLARWRRGVSEQSGWETSGSGPLNHQYSAIGGEFGDIRVFFCPCIIIVTRLWASATPASRHRGRLQRRGASSVSRIRFSPALCRQRGWGGPGTGSVEDFLLLGWTLEDAQATVSKNLWIPHAEVGLSICIIAEHKGMRSGLVPVVAGWAHIGCWSLPPLKHVTTLLPRLTARACLQTWSGLVWSSLGKISLALICALGLPVLARLCVCMDVCLCVCVWSVDSHGRERTCCSIHQNARIVFSHGRAASRAYSGGHGFETQARSALMSS